MSKQRKLSQWHCEDPVHIGVYQTNYYGEILAYVYWDGERFGWAQISIAKANMDRNTQGATQRKQWRGLVRK